MAWVNAASSLVRLPLVALRGRAVGPSTRHTRRSERPSVAQRGSPSAVGALGSKVSFGGFLFFFFFYVRSATARVNRVFSRSSSLRRLT